MRVTESVNKTLLNSYDEIIVYGAGYYGEIALKGLNAWGYKVDFFVDRAHIGEEYWGRPVHAPAEIVKHRDAIVLIASLNYFSEIVQYLTELGQEHIYDMEAILMDQSFNSELSEFALDEKINYQKYLNMIQHGNSNELIVGHCELVVTECCTLHCKDCGNLMQYYTRPENIDMEQIIKGFDLFLESIDTLLEMRILGGEPFCFQNLDEVINHYRDNKKIKRITIYTNATIVPQQKVIDSLKDSKITVHMSDYGACSKKILELQEALKNNKILYYVHRYEDWSDMGEPEDRKYTENELKQVYRTCATGKCYTLYRGKFFVCPRAAHGERLGYFENKDFEVIDYLDQSISIEEKRKKLNHIIETTQWITACKYCKGNGVSSKHIKAAIQL